MDMQGIYDLVGDKIRDLFDAQAVSMCTFNYKKSKEEKGTDRDNFENDKKNI